MKTTISNSDDVIDYRDVIARIEELQGALDTHLDAIRDAEAHEEKCQAFTALFDWMAEDIPDDMIDPDTFDLSAHVSPDSSGNEAEELLALLNLQKEAEGSPDWTCGETLIRDSYFQQYAEQLADDICDMKNASAWPFCHIDWEAAAEALKCDYTEVDFDGVAYWIRA